MNPVAKAGYFGVLFDLEPIYQDLISGTNDITKIRGVNKRFLALGPDQFLLAGAGGFEPAAFGFGDQRSNQLSYAPMPLGYSS